MMKTGFSILVLACIIGIEAIGQVYPLMPKYYQPLDSVALANKKVREKPKDGNPTLMKQHEKFSYSVNLGTSFSSFGNNLSMMSSYIAPTVNYRVNSKLNVVVNGVIMQNNYNGLGSILNSKSSYANSSNVSNYGISGAAIYQLNDKWTIWGDGAYFENQPVFNNNSSGLYNTDYKTISLGVGYKINDKLHFNIQCRYSDGFNPTIGGINPRNSWYDPNNQGYIWGY